MAEPTTNYSYTNLLNEVGWFLGKTGTSLNWTAAEIAKLGDIVQSGIQQFYGAYNWTFLFPTTTFTAWASVATSASNTVTATYASPTFTITSTAAEFYPEMVGHTLYIYLSGTGSAATAFTITGYTSSTVVSATSTHSTAISSGKQYYMTADGNYTMPDSFAGLKGPLHFEPTTGYMPVKLSSEHTIMDFRQRYTTSGRPYAFALRPRVFVAATGQRWESLLFPTPDSNYTLYYKANYANRDKLSATDLYSLGGTQHAQTIREYCLAQADMMVNGNVGIHAAERDRLLAASIRTDGYNVPESLGYVGNDDSGYSADAKDYPINYSSYTTYNGTPLT